MFEYTIEITYTAADDRYGIGRLTDEVDIILPEGNEFTHIWNIIQDYYQADSIDVLDVRLPEETREELRSRGYDL